MGPWTQPCGEDLVESIFLLPVVACYNADRIIAFSLFGEVYVAQDAGASWRKIPRQFGENRAAVWLPN